MDFHKLRNDLRRNGYNVGYIDLSTSKILMELFNDLRTVMAVVGTKDVELPIKQKGNFFFGHVVFHMATLKY